MSRFPQIFLLFLTTCLLLVSVARGALIDRGGGLIYDSDQDITWLQDANYAQTSGFNADGLMNSWEEAMAWADGLEFGGFDDWRLPTTTQPDPSCETQFGDIGIGNGCTGSEMGHLSNVDGVLAVTPGPFSNIQSSGRYWSSTELASNPLFQAWVFGFSNDIQNTAFKNTDFFPAWAVRDGDVSPPQDTDGDGIPDESDNCPFVANISQANSDPLAPGDACQCGDVNNDFIVDGLDAQIARENLVGSSLSGSFDPGRCNVIGASNCGVDDIFVLVRVAAGLPVSLQNICDAYLGGP